MITQKTVVTIGGVEFTDDVLANVRVDMGARTAWEQNVAGIASILIRQDDPGIIISDDVRIQVESPETDTIATGGTVTTIVQGGVDYRVHTFTSDGTFTANAPISIEYLVVAGGGGGGADIGGGGGAGGLLTNIGSPVQLPAGSYTITVGQGGAGATSNTATGAKGGDSSIGTVVVATGGGGGKSRTSGVGNSAGGSGGGGAWTLSGDSRPGGLGTAGQGFDGGDGSPNIAAAPYRSGGGGGAGEQGQDAGANSGDGGDGIESSINGSATYYAGGGGGGFPFAGGAAGSGGLGGGGDGVQTPASQRNGTPNTGGGGGGGPTGAVSVYFGGTGGSGIVIIRYKDAFQTVFHGRVDTTSAELTDLGPIWAITASGPLTKAGRRELTGIIAADTEGDQIALLAQEALAAQWAETPDTWANQTLTWDGFAVDTSQIDQPGQYALAAIDQLPANVVEAMTTAAFSGSGWLYETRDGLLGYADSTHRELTPESEYLVIPGSATSRNQFLTATREADIANDIIVEYDGGDVAGQATDSMPIYGRWQRTYTTTLADQSAAEAFLTRRLELEGAPRLNVAGSILIDLNLVTPTLFDQLLTVERNSGVILEDVPTYLAAESRYRGFVEGYIWNLGPIDPTLELFVSEYSLSNFGLRWAAAGPPQWNQVGVSLTWQDATEALA